MDPDAALDSLRGYIGQLDGVVAHPEKFGSEQLVEVLELVASLDSSLTKGEALPAFWSANRWTIRLPRLRIHRYRH